ncbi:MAG: lipid-binding SYLF domain-containing protein [Bryobacteraceae bacterium]|nr:lipid-binding SYLF domain-containing protein [Bryobacteraceae bacterium]MCX7603077.1 lipid-binding SYLF domain-containing protein [Bryobacteraceae bacterium]
MKRLLIASVFSCLCVYAGKAEEERLKAAATVLQEIMAIEDKAIPQDLFSKARCAIIIPGAKKGGFIVGAKYGRGFAACRMPDNQGWTAPVGVRIEGGSFGLQIGGAEVDIVMLVMNQSGMERLLSSKFTIGADATGAAGPVGRSTSAQTDATMRAEILSWSRSRGIFGGLTLQGATMREDRSVDEALYGAGVDRREVLRGKRSVPPAAKELVSLLNKYSAYPNK